jgi:hypothetical protein
MRAVGFAPTIPCQDAGVKDRCVCSFRHARIKKGPDGCLALFVCAASALTEKLILSLVAFAATLTLAIALCSDWMADQLLVRQPTTDDVMQRLREARPIIVGALVKPERLLIEIPEQVERLDANICPANRALQ